MNSNSSLLQGERMAHAIVEEAKANRQKVIDESQVEASAVINKYQRDLDDQFRVAQDENNKKISELDRNE